jgi:hypothetical protein
MNNDLPPDEGLPPGLLAIVDTVGADIFARLVCHRYDLTNGSIDNTEFQWLADVALAASSAWGLRRHQTCEPCCDRPAP